MSNRVSARIAKLYDIATSPPESTVVRNPATTTPTSEDTAQVEQYERQAQSLKEDMKSFQERIQKNKQGVKELQGIYLHGLDTIASLQDLSDVPDAILPGNFKGEAK